MISRGLSSAIAALRKGRLLFLFVLFVLVPTAPLAWLALESIAGEHASPAARIDDCLRRVADAAVRIAMRPLLDCVPELSRRIRPGLSPGALAAEVVEGGKACPYVSGAFLLDHRLRPLHPFREPAERTADILFDARPDERLMAYSRAMRRGSAKEFIAGDPSAALEEYQFATGVAGNPQARAIAMLAAARCAMKLEQFPQAVALYREILSKTGEGVSYNGLSLRLLTMYGTASAKMRAGAAAEAADLFLEILRRLAAGELAMNADEASLYASMIGDRRGELAGAAAEGAGGAAAFDAAHRDWRSTERTAREMELLRGEFGPDFRRVLDEGGGARILSRGGGGGETLVACIPVAVRGQARTALLVVALDSRGLRETLQDILPDAVASEPDVNIALADGGGNVIAARGSPESGSPHSVTRTLAPLLPSWRLRLTYRLDGLLYQIAARERRARLIYSSLLISIIFLGLYLIYRLAKKDSELARLKSDFVSRVSHELRTPLSTIRAVGEMLEMGAVSSREKEREYFTYITSEGQRLSRLIDNVLDFSRIGAGKRTYTLRPVDIASTVSSTVRAFRQYVHPEGFEIAYEADADIPRVEADEDAVSQALINLLDNAVKFSREERIVRVELRARGREVLLRVSDRGIGIAPGDLGKVFHQFYRLDEGRKVARKGAGIGLSIVKHIAEAHGGRVEVQSALGEGSAFTIAIPVPHGA